MGSGRAPHAYYAMVQKGGGEGPTTAPLSFFLRKTCSRESGRAPHAYYVEKAGKEWGGSFSFFSFANGEIVFLSELEWQSTNCEGIEREERELFPVFFLQS